MRRDQISFAHAIHANPSIRLEWNRSSMEQYKRPEISEEEETIETKMSYDAYSHDVLRRDAN